MEGRQQQQQQQQLCIVTVGDGDTETFELHRIEEEDEPRRSGNIQIQSPLPSPFFRVTGPSFPKDANFAAIGSRIFIVGGYTQNLGAGGQIVDSNQVFIVDPNTKECVNGPSMISGKVYPYLISIGSKLFALSTLVGFRMQKQNEFPRFEVLDTDDLSGCWTALDVPTALDVSSDGEFSWAATSDYIFVSVGNSGTWVFNLNNSRWTQARQDRLPFFGEATTLPNLPNVCCTQSNRSGKLCVFRFQFDNNSLVIDEFGVDDSLSFPPLSPSLMCCDLSRLVAFNDGRIYFVSGGVDHACPLGNRYIQVYAARLNQRHFLRPCSHTRSNDDAVKDLQLTPLWSGSFFGGPAIVDYMQVIAAFVV